MPSNILAIHNLSPMTVKTRQGVDYIVLVDFLTGEIHTMCPVPDEIFEELRSVVTAKREEFSSVLGSEKMLYIKESMQNLNNARAAYRKQSEEVKKSTTLERREKNAGKNQLEPGHRGGSQEDEIEAV